MGGWFTRLIHWPATTTENTRHSDTATMPMPAVALVPAFLPKNRISRNDTPMMAGTIQTLSRRLGITMRRQPFSRSTSSASMLWRLR